VESVSFSPDGKRIVSGSSETFRLWDASTGKELLNIKLPATHFAALDTACFSPDGKRIISGIRHRIRLWDAYSGNELLTLSGHSSFVKAVGFSPDGKRVVSGSSDKTLKLWDASTGKELLTLSGHTDGVTSAAFSPDGKRIISVSRDGTLKLWDSSSGKELLTLTGTGWFTKSVCFSPDGKQIISGAGNKIKLWDASSGNELLTLSGHTGKVTCVSFSPDDKRIVSGGAGNKIKLWDASSGDELLTLTGRTFSVSRSAVHSDGHHTATSHFHSASKVVFSSDGKQIHSEDSASEKYTWNSKNGNPISDAQLHSPFDTESRMLSKDGRRKLIISGSQVLVVDLEFKETPREKAYRKVKARFKPRWHQELAAKATSEENFYAATFHNAWLVKNNPENAKLIEAFQSSYEKLEAQFKKEDRNLVDYVSPVVVETIELLHQLLVQADPNDVNKQRELSISYERLGDIHLKDGNTEEALQSFRNGMEVRQKLSAANPSDLELQRDYSTSFERLGNLYFGVNRGEEAIKIFQDWLELNQKLSKANPSHPNLQRDLMVSHYKIGAVHFENANYEVAKEKFELGVDVLNQMIAKGQLVEQSKREKVLLQGQIAECDKLVKPPEDTEQTGDESNE
jgi:WD40 repeat protein